MVVRTASGGVLSRLAVEARRFGWEGSCPMVVTGHGRV